MARFDVDTLVEEVLGEATGHTIDVGQMSWLASSMDASQTTMSVDTSGTRLSRGIVEVGDELVFVASINQDTGEATLAPFGRGYMGTDAQSHPQNERVTMTPRFPRKRILDAMNDVLRSTFPSIFAVTTTTFQVAGGGRISYELPAAVDRVLRVEVSTVGPSNDWETADRWFFNRNAVTTAFPSGRSLDLYEYQVPGRTVQVTYAKQPAALTLAGVFTDSGLRESAWPCILYGTLHRLLTGAVAGESGSESVQAATKNRQHRSDPAGVQREYFTLHRQYLLDERDRLLTDYPATNNMER